MMLFLFRLMIMILGGGVFGLIRVLVIRNFVVWLFNFDLFLNIVLMRLFSFRIFVEIYFRLWMVFLSVVVRFWFGVSFSVVYLLF